jgi:hypothetical protein
MDENVMERAKKLPRTSRATISVSASEKIDDYESAEAWAGVHPLFTIRERMSQPV